MKKSNLVAGACLSIIAYFGIAQANSDSIDKTFAVAAGGTLYVDSDAGTIDIESHDQDSVEVRVYRSGRNAEDFEVSFDHSGDDVTIKGDKYSNWGWGSLSVKYEIRVPSTYNVDVKTGGGSIDVEDLTGDMIARTSGGSIDLGAINGDVDVKTSGGSIRVEDVAGNIRAHTSGGSVKAKLSQQLTEDCKLTTSGGSISAYLAPSMAVDINASTSGGRVRSDFDVDGTVKKTRIEGAINGGGPKLTLRTSGGSVSINRL